MPLKGRYSVTNLKRWEESGEGVERVGAWRLCLSVLDTPPLDGTSLPPSEEFHVGPHFCGEEGLMDSLPAMFLSPPR